jgi:hypothetical protein
MSRVASALEEITDRGLFEELATAVLRRTIPEARTLIHLGVNAHSRTVRSPVDGIAPGDGSTGLLLVSHATTAARDLRTKWLQHPEGDVAKALRPTIGLLLCNAKDRLIVEYALRDMTKPLGVGAWETRIVESLPKQLEGSLPSGQQLEQELTRNSD